MDKRANNNSTDVGKRINETKREIAQLNEELEKLINCNVNKKNPLLEVPEKNLEKKASVATIINRCDNSFQSPLMGSGSVMKYSKQSKTSSIFNPSNMDNVETLCKKTKSYNKEEAKEYIRQQRERREEERKKLNSKSKIDQEIKKQKLFELQQKSLALVQRNIQLKRERSKSRENGLQIRIDKSTCSNKTTKMLDKETASYKPYTHKMNSVSNFSFQNSDELKNVKIRIDDEKCNILNVPVKSKKRFTDNGMSGHSRIENPSENLEVISLKYVPYRNMSVRLDGMDILTYVNQDLAATKIQAYYRGYRLRKKIRNIQSKSDHCMRIDTYPKESKETQTNIEEQQIVTPVWLQPPSIDPYPCNFINTVKRKLQFAMNSVNSRDMGTQSSIIGSCSHDLVKCDNKNEDKVQLGEKSCIKDRLISFNSHKCSNLDVDALQHLVLVHNEKKTRHNINGSTESESDTSKNIPEISSEGALVPNPHDETVSLENSNNLIINTDRIKDLHLKDPINRYKATSQTFNEVLGDSVNIDRSMSKKSYTFNFYDEHNTEDEDDSIKQAKSEEQKYVKSPRDSIVSFNRSEYRNSSHDKIATETSFTSLGSNQSIQSEKQNSRSPLKTSILSSYMSSDIHQNNSNILMKSNISGKYEESSPSKIIENIENSINTSLISHISDNKSDSSYVSSSQSKKSSNPSTSKSFVTKKHTPKALLVPSISSINLRKHTHLDDHEPANSIEIASKLLIPMNSSSISIEEEATNSNYEEKNQIIPKPPKVNNNFKTLNNEQFSSNLTNSNLKQNKQLEHSSTSTKYSNLTIRKKKFGQHENSQSQSEVTSPYSTNFSSEKTDSLKKTEDISEQNKFPKSEENNLENENCPQIDTVNPENDIINNLNSEKENDAHIVKNISSKIFRSKGDMNEIHLKFEAEVHLLNDFNESLKQFMAVEKAFETIKNKNEGSCMKFHSRNSSISNGPSFSEQSNISVNLSKSKLSSVNLCRGSEMDVSNFSNESLLRPLWKSMDNSMDLEISNAEKNIDNSSITVREKLPNNLAGLSIKMFEQLIKDEDVRIENLKTIIKIREQALLDRTKGELAWLEIQRKHLRETGRLHEASLVKKKQRGILLKHQQERREMQRLKQLQKMQSNERKIILKEQRNLIKAKLTSEKDMSELKMHTPRKRQSNGPMKVLKTSGSVHSETSISKRTTDLEEILSITSKSQSIRLSEGESSRELIVNTDETNIRMIGDQNNLSNMKQALLIRQTALMERRKAVEDLLYRHQKLLEEEKKIEELEMAANAIIMQMPTINHPKTVDGNKLNLKGNHLSELCRKKGLLSEKKLVDNKFYCISQSTYNKLHDDKTNYNMKRGNDSQLRESSNNKSSVKTSTDIESDIDDIVCKVTENEKSVQGDDSVSQKKSFEYSEDFELEPGDIINDVNPMPDSNENNLSSISELIQDFSEIEHGISMLSKQLNPASSSITSHNSHSGSESISESKLSVLETSVMQNLNNVTDNPTVLSEMLQSDDNCQEIEMPIESLKQEELSETENMISSIVTAADPLDSIEIETENSSKMMSKTFIEDVVPSTETVFQHSQSENTPKRSNEEDHEVNETNQENAINGNEQFCEEPSHDKSLMSDNAEQMTSEVEDEILSNNSSNLKTHVSLPKDEIIHETSIIQTVTEDSSKPMDCIDCKEVTEEPDHSITNSSMEEVHNSTIINEKLYLSDRSNLRRSESKSNENISEIVNEDTDSMKHSLTLEQSNSDLIKEKETNKKFNLVSGDLSTESCLEEENVKSSFGNELASPVCENIPSEQTIHEDSLDLNRSQLHQIDNQTSVAISNINNLLSLENKSTSKKTIEESSDESYSGIAKLFENELSKSNTTTGFNSTDISEKLSTDSEHLDISELSSGDSSDNYTDDFDDDKEGDSPSHKDLKNYSNGELVPVNECDSNSTSLFNSSEVKKKKTLQHKENEVFMMKIDLTRRESNNEASIVVMLENKPNSQEKSYKIENVPGKEFSSLPDDNRRSEVDDIRIIEQKSAFRNTDSEVENLEIVKPKVLPIKVIEREPEILINTVDSPKSIKDEDERYQDYVTTYEDVTPVNSPESASPVKSTPLPSLNIFGTEAEELLKKQIAIEQEIKHLEQQQKEHLPFVYMREIPNKPPPPYTPPSTLSSHTATLLPSKVEDVDEICNYSAKVLYNAYLSNKLNDVTFSETDFKSINQTKSTEECCLFVFDLCREVAKNHYKRFEKDNDPNWLKVSSDSRLILGKPFDYCQLEKYINKKVKNLLGFEKENIKENSVARWIKKKKDHVDEILALESQFEEKEWLDYEKDELMVKNEVTNEIFNILLNETIDIYKKIFS